MNAYKVIKVNRWSGTKVTGSPVSAKSLDDATVEAVNNEWDGTVQCQADIIKSIWGEIIDFDNCRFLQLDEGIELLIVTIS